ncbi:thiaminase II [Bacillus aquiflavi]|uniref:Aminopyrimidine aminohydrolase n=1 Tax=Bacillus aquiflavi TaxID=2672567 RepID=A0A6B3W1C3_9BACI|nr:thiaminase II [Bacillus aquiflavi]MBA4538011.1 thiaminase II [Bacillus aquiflavi]NEY82267.1 thiaminase II [Bacillus aquiflavi]UAC48821.1 thiaminase II [Bacillus aquiflavi]
MSEIKVKRFTDRLFENAQEVWGKNHEHPFVQGIGKGTLSKDVFAYYMKQDYAYLIDYSKLFALGVLKSQTLDQMNKFSHILHETLHFEMELHRQYADEFGISREDLEKTEPTPVNLAYTRYMLNTGQNGSLAELVSCLLPCAWDYWEIGKLLKEKYGENLSSNPYKNWVETYSSTEFGQLAIWLIDMMDELAEGKPERELAELEKHFLITSKYEYLFWDMVYNQEDWKV